VNAIEFTRPATKASVRLALLAMCCLSACQTRESPRPVAVETTSHSTPAAPQPEPVPPLECRLDLLPADVQAVMQRLLKDFPEDAEAVFSLGSMFDFCGQSDEAIRCWEHCVLLDPSFGQAHTRIAIIASRRGQFDEAAQHLLRAREASPELTDTGLLIRKTLLDLGRTEEALVELERQAAAHPATEEWFWLGQAHFQLQHYPQAKECYEKALVLNNEATAGWFGLSQVCERLGETERAERCRERFRVLDAEHAEIVRSTRTAPPSDDTAAAHAYVVAGRLYAAHNNATEAEACWRRAAKLDPINVSAREGLAKLLTTHGRGPEAILVVEELLIIQPTNLEALLVLTTLYKQSNNVQAVEQCLQQVLHVAPEHAPAQAALAQLYLSQGLKLPEAQRLAASAARLEPTGENYFLLSALCLANQDRPGAAEALQAALRLEPFNPKFLESARVLGNP